MRPTAALALLLAAGCAAQPAVRPGPAAAPASVTAAGTDVIVNLGNEPTTRAEHVDAAAHRVWAALPGAFTELGLAPGAADGASRTLASGQRTIHRRLLGEPASAFFDCGRATTGERAADAYRVTLSVRATVSGEGTGSRVATVVDASARNPEGTSSTPVRCLSTGRLEARLADVLRRRLHP